MYSIVQYPTELVASMGFENPKHHHLQHSNLLNLPGHLLSLIFGKLCFKDKIFFGVVCHSFHSIFKEDTKQTCCPLPLLMVPTQDNTATHSFYSIFDDSNLFGKVPLDHSTFCRGTRHGWLVTVNEDLSMSLFNPFLSQDNNKIQLPPVTTFESTPFDFDEVRYYNTVAKATISADPLSSTEDCVVMVIYGLWRRVAFCKPGDKSWTTLTLQVTNLEDIIYYRGKFHVVDQDGRVFSCDLNRDADSKLTRIAPVLWGLFTTQRYIVESESTGDLMQITRNVLNDEFIRDYVEEEAIAELMQNARPVGIPEDSPFTTGFNVFKMDADSGNWIEVHNLQGCSFFVGDNTSLSVYIPAADTHGYGCNKPNTIWFTDDNYAHQEVTREVGYGPYDVGVFDLQDGTVKPTYPMKVEFIAPPPIWIQPILC